MSFYCVRVCLGVIFMVGLTALARSLRAEDYYLTFCVVLMMGFALVPLARGIKPRRWEITWEQFAQIKAQTPDEFIALKLKLGF